MVILSWEPGEAAEPILDMEAGTHPADQLQQRFIGAARTWLASMRSARKA